MDIWENKIVNSQNKTTNIKKIEGKHNLIGFEFELH